MTLEDAAGLVAVIVLWAWKPGPGHLMLVSRYVTDGAKATIAMMVGMALAQSIFVVVAMAGFHSIEPDHPIARGIQAVAAGMLVVAGTRALLSHASDVPEPNPKTRHGALASHFFTGLSLSLTNPMNVTFYAAVLPTFTVSADPAVIALVAGLVLATLTIGDVMYLFLARRCRAFLTTPRCYAPVAAAFHILFLTVGGWILVDNAGFL